MPSDDKQKQIAEKVKRIIVKQLHADGGKVTPSASFVDDLGADSLGTVELAMALEEQFDIKIPDEDAEEIRTMRGTVEYIIKRSESNNGLPARSK